MSNRLALLLLAGAVACSSDSGGKVTSAATTDSAGIAVMTYPGSVLDEVPAWQLDSSATVRIDGNDLTDVDISAVEVAAFLPDGGFVTTPPMPASILRFGPDGSRLPNLGGPGAGPGEYQLLLSLMYANDTVMALEPMRNRWLLYRGDGSFLSEVELPAMAVGSIGIPTGRLDDGRFIAFTAGVAVTSDGGIDAGGEGITRRDLPVTSWRSGAGKVDTLFTVPGPETVRSTIDFGGQSIPMPRAVALGAQSAVATTGTQIWSSTGDRYELVVRDGDGRIERIVRVDRAPRPVADSDREAYRSSLREVLQRAGQMMPPEILESELAKIDETPFATNVPPVARIVPDGGGNAWVSGATPMLGASLGPTTWHIFDRNGEIRGRVTIPAGHLLAVSGDRLLIKVEDKATGDVALQVMKVIPTSGSAE